MTNDNQPDDAIQQWIDAIEAFEIDDGPAAYTFAQRLADENGYDPDYADRVIREYRRFIVLMIVAGHPVTPSQDVDNAWHLHLTYTHSYMDRLCDQLIGRTLHHNPTKGGETEDAKFRQQYLDTLDSYRDIFGEEPPADIWPSVDERFGSPIGSNVSAGEPMSDRLFYAILAPFSIAAFSFIGAAITKFIAPDSPIQAIFGLSCIGFAFAGFIALIVAENNARGGGGGGGCGSGGIVGGCGGDAGCGGGGCGGGGCGGG